MKPLPVPYLVRRLEDGAALEIHWDQVGHVGIYAARELRLACPCAACRDEVSGAPILAAAGVPADVRAAAKTGRNRPETIRHTQGESACA